jgi:hypothetical protein
MALKPSIDSPQLWACAPPPASAAAEHAETVTGANDQPTASSIIAASDSLSSGIALMRQTV